MKWRTCLIGEFVDSGLADIQTGPFGTQLKASDYVSDGTPVINVRNIGYADLRPEKLEYVGESVTDRLSAHLLQENDIVFGRKGAVDRHLFVTSDQGKWMQGSDCIRLRFDTVDVHSKFLSYTFLLKSHQQWMLTQSGNKATMASLNQEIIKRIPLKLPPRPLQTEIVKILSTYDDLIENNRRRMALLEDVVRQVYQEWFVRLRYPGHEHTRIVDGVPEGWVSLQLSDLCRIGRGASPRPIIDYMGGDIPWFKIGDATGSESPFVFHTQECVTDSGAKKSIPIEQGALILSNSATCGIPFIAGVYGCIHDGWLHFSDYTRINERFLYFLLQGKREELVNSVSDGSTQKNLNTTAVGRLMVVIPESNLLLQQFDDISKPVLEQIYNLARQNIALRTARDLLLPKLMSGEIAV